MAFNESFSTPTVGVTVRSATGEDLGHLSDVVFDASTGSPRFAAIELKSDSTLLVMPWEALRFQTGGRIQLNITAEELTAAPRVESASAARLAEVRWGRDLDTYAERPLAHEFLAPQDPEERANPKRHRVGMRLAAGAFVMVLLAGLGYLLLRRTSPPSDGQVSSLVVETMRHATEAVRETSTDTATTMKVKAALALSKRVPASDVIVDTRHAVATLKGKVTTPAVRDTAAAIAADTDGVLEVRNLLTVVGEVAP